jgi:hypothetical protein
MDKRALDSNSKLKMGMGIGARPYCWAAGQKGSVDFERCTAQRIKWRSKRTVRVTCNKEKRKRSRPSSNGSSRRIEKWALWNKLNPDISQNGRSKLCFHGNRKCAPHKKNRLRERKNGIRKRERSTSLVQYRPRQNFAVSTLRGPYNNQVMLAARGRHAACLRKRHAGSLRALTCGAGPSAALAAYSSVIRTEATDGAALNR